MDGDAGGEGDAGVKEVVDNVEREWSSSCHPTPPLTISVPSVRRPIPPRKRTPHCRCLFSLPSNKSASRAFIERNPIDIDAEDLSYPEVICDDTYSDKSWAIVAPGMFRLREVNQTEREACNYLDWELTVDNPILSNFETAFRQDFAQDHRPYPNYPLTTVSKRAARRTQRHHHCRPGFGQHRQSPSTTRPDSSQNSSSKQWKAPRSDPDTPSPSHSNTTSPAPSASPQTPLNLETDSARIHGVDASPPFT
ncbi:hypothetical protein DFP72DRAFT_1066861 [Ephemerocybe angulata]|nr:hypothetical protein DFP72DRAFT_1066861 [Tulosesus angulatus]